MISPPPPLPSPLSLSLLVPGIIAFGIVIIFVVIIRLFIQRFSKISWPSYLSLALGWLSFIFTILGIAGIGAYQWFNNYPYLISFPVIGFFLATLALIFGTTFFMTRKEPEAFKAGLIGLLTILIIIFSGYMQMFSNASPFGFFPSFQPFLTYLLFFAFIGFSALLGVPMEGRLSMGLFQGAIVSLFLFIAIILGAELIIDFISKKITHQPFLIKAFLARLIVGMTLFVMLAFAWLIQLSIQMNSYELRSLLLYLSSPMLIAILFSIIIGVGLYRINDQNRLWRYVMAISTIALLVGSIMTAYFYYHAVYLPNKAYDTAVEQNTKAFEAAMQGLRDQARASCVTTEQANEKALSDLIDQCKSDAQCVQNAKDQAASGLGEAFITNCAQAEFNRHAPVY